MSPFGIDAQDTMTKIITLIISSVIIAVLLFIWLLPELRMGPPDFEDLLVISFAATFIAMVTMVGFIYIVKRNATARYLQG